MNQGCQIYAKIDQLCGQIWHLPTHSVSGLIRTIFVSVRDGVTIGLTGEVKVLYFSLRPVTPVALGVCRDEVNLDESLW